MGGYSDLWSRSGKEGGAPPPARFAGWLGRENACTVLCQRARAVLRGRRPRPQTQGRAGPDNRALKPQTPRLLMRPVAAACPLCQAPSSMLVLKIRPCPAEPSRAGAPPSLTLSPSMKKQTQSPTDHHSIRALEIRSHPKSPYPLQRDEYRAQSKSQAIVHAPGCSKPAQNRTTVRFMVQRH